MRRILRTLVAVGAAVSAVFVGAGSPASAGSLCDSSFHVFTTPNASSGGTTLDAVAAFSPTNAWAVGTGNGEGFSIHWNGTNWSEVSVPVVAGGDQLFAVAMAGAHDLWAVGVFTNAHGKARSLALHRTGSTWVHVPTPNVGKGPNSLFRLSVVAPDDVWAAGEGTVGGDARALVLHWNGTRWTKVDFPTVIDGQNFMEGMTAAGPNDVWVVLQLLGASGHDRAATFHRVGSSWHRVPFTQPTAFDVSPRDLFALGHNSIWMAGFYDDTGAAVPMLEHWNGVTWKQFTGVNPTSFVFLEGLAALGPHAVYTFGNYEDGSTTHSLVEKFNGTAWHQVSSEDVGGADLTVLDGGAAVSAGSQHRVFTAGSSETGGVRHSVVEISCP